jgi:hypothetical protein
LQQLEGQKEIPIIQNLIYKSLKKGWEVVMKIKNLHTTCNNLKERK